ncbi:3-hydroxyacyl-CoA dehydrogenase NAD-binding domain-containing protein (plasmid) [Sinorhizobium garamanticum]|uniref:3-hydroxyacyl-CoA dehydrogenase NAD-binding domain-containing protein n=1 Tax=Sinorhizobium garamanticum TaxID=680247 RepID=A0ABY8DMT3_9HYPH|nr:3-hydroxyacyl-CoA dehydrogenase NAD-binding domain-containing protein [Sinorhizobium garamanticum]WEX91642.1 3-hydroxyacyl-CoA dehydrogenase NAD-binding domain-containing protein [Sinorhizobium garamanticum]
MGTQLSEHCFKSVVCIGAGNIGAGWAAHFMRAGLDVIVYDPVAERKEWLDGYLMRAMPALEQLGLSPDAGLERVRFTTNLEDALSGAKFIQESSPEVLNQKKDLFQKMTDIAPRDAIIASSSAGFLAKDLRSMAKGPERIIIGHPFNPPYLIPLVEIAGGEEASNAANTAAAFYNSTGCEVVELKREIEGYIGNRIQAAVLKEIFYIYSQGVADLDTIDRAIATGPAIRWAVMGPSSVFYLGTQRPDMYEGFVKGLVDEIKGGFVADSEFDIDEPLIAAYAREVQQKIGSNGQTPLLDRRNAGVIALRKALELIAEKREHGSTGIS